MVEFNANGLHGFYNLMKNLSVAVVRIGKEWLVYLVEQILSKSQ